MTLVKHIDEIRRMASDQLDQGRRSDRGQFMTPSSVANFMVSLFQKWPKNVRLLDPGAGVGSLSEAFARQFKKKSVRFSRLDMTAYEIEPLLATYLRERMANLGCNEEGSLITSKVLEQDFIPEGSFAASFGIIRFTHIILNPPYKKISADSAERKSLQAMGVEVPNLYVAFLALAVGLTEEGGEIVAIIPRSFCNGSYFRPFRHWLLQRVAITHVHIFESRRKIFGDDNVLQENIIVRLVRNQAPGTVTVSQSKDNSFEDCRQRKVPFSEIVKSDDKESYIHVPLTERSWPVHLFAHRLADLGIEVSTGPVVDFRAKESWLEQPDGNCAPLLYAHHFPKGVFQWPRNHKKPNAISITPATKKILMPRGWYVAIKRFSSKEEKRRVVAYVVDPNRLPYDFYGFENHLNILHVEKRGMSEDMARGVALYLNSTLVDTFFRTFSGHTQVNATDLRMMRFPEKDKLVQFGAWARSESEPTQEKIDAFIQSYGK